MDAVIAYASRTGTRRNLRALSAYGWRLLLSADEQAVWNAHGFRYCIDNGAWSDFKKGTQWDERRFTLLVLRFGLCADWIALPDIVLGGLASLDISLSWIERVRWTRALLLIPVQDGMRESDLRPHVGANIGIFVGGSTEWKEQSLPMWSALKRETGCYLHVGRVNTARRIALCAHAGADSFDGTSVSMYAETARELSKARDQLSMLPALCAQPSALAESAYATTPLHGEGDHKAGADT